MDKLSRLFKEIRTTQSPYEKTTDKQLALIADRCQRDEVAAIYIRLRLFNAELAACPEWDGDTLDQIRDAIHTHERLLAMIERNRSA